MWGTPQRKYNVYPVVAEPLLNLFRDIAEHRREDLVEFLKSILFQAQEDPVVLRHLSPFFWRDYYTPTAVWPGNTNCPNVDTLLRGEGSVQQVRIPLSKGEWFRLDNLAYALCRTVHQAASTLLVLTVSSDALFGEIVSGIPVHIPPVLRKVQ